MITQKRKIVAPERNDAEGKQHQRRRRELELGESLVPEGSLRPWDKTEEDRRQYAKQANISDHAGIDQIAGFARVRFENVAHHVGIDDDAVFVHEIAGRGRHRKHDRDDDLQHGLQGNREQQQIRDENHRHESGGKEQPLFSVVRRDHGKEPSPESMVEHQRDERGDE